MNRIFLTISTTLITVFCNAQSIGLKTGKMILPEYESPFTEGAYFNWNNTKKFDVGFSYDFLFRNTDNIRCEGGFFEKLSGYKFEVNPNFLIKKNSHMQFRMGPSVAYTTIKIIEINSIGGGWSKTNFLSVGAVGNFKITDFPFRNMNVDGFVIPEYFKRRNSSSQFYFYHCSYSYVVALLFQLGISININPPREWEAP